MKKLLLVALLMLALVFTVVACNDDPPADTTAGETTATQDPATAEPDVTTAEPEDPTAAPETTVAPETTAEPETTVDDTPATQAPVTTKEPETTVEPETEDPMAPVNVFEADALVPTGGEVNGVTSAEVVDGVLHVVPSTADPYWYPFANIKGARYVAIRYRTADATNGSIQFYIGSTGTGPSDDTSMLQQSAIVDGEWHLAIFDTQSLIDAGKYDGSTVSYFRFDPLEAGYILDENGEPYKPDGQNWARYELPAGCSIDIEYIGFFHSAEAAEKYDADTHFVVPPHDDQTLALGTGHGAPFSGAGDKKFGHRGQIGENFLKNVTINELATYSDGGVNTWSFKVWQWNTDYATTVAGEPLFVANGENHPDNSTFSMNIPADLGIRGDIYYEIEYLSGSGGFTGWTADADSVIPGLETYVAGNLASGSYSASITVGVAKAASYDNLTIDLSATTPNEAAKYVPTWPEAGWTDTAVIQMMNYGSAASLGEIDLSKYSAVIITYGSDASAVQGDVGTFLALTKNGAAENNDSSDKADVEIIAQGTLANAGGGWTTTREVTIAIDSDYVGEVFLAQDMKDGNGIAITSIVFIGAEIPVEPETPVVELTPFDGTYHANVDHINGKGPAGAANYAGLGSSVVNSDGSTPVRNAADDGIVVNEDYTVSIGGWMSVLGGINHYAYTVNGGELIAAVGGTDGEPLPDYFKNLGMENSLKNGMFNGANFVIADLSAYAGQTVTVTFYAVPETAQDTVAPIVSIEGLVVPAAAEAPAEDVTIDPRTLPEGSITGHMPVIVPKEGHSHSAMIAAAGLESGAMIHAGSIYLGEFDLTKYEKVIIYFASDWGDGTQTALAAAKEQGFGYLGLSAVDCNGVVNPDRTYFIGEQYTPDGGWTITAHELPNVEDSGYKGSVYVSADFLEGQFIIIDRIEFIAK